MKTESTNGLTTIVDQDLFKVTRHVGPYDVVCYTINGGETAGRITLSEKTFLKLVDELVKIRVDAAGLPKDPAPESKLAYVIT